MKKFVLILSLLLLAFALVFFEYSSKPEPDEISIKNDRLIFHYNDPGRSQQIETDILPPGAKKRSLSFRSRDTSIAEVTKSGLVTAKGVLGETVIDITCGELTAEVNVSVVHGVTGIGLSRSDILLYADAPSSEHIDTFFYPDEADIREVTWYSSDESAAHVDNDGNVYPCGIGAAAIYAVTADGGHEAGCTVLVESLEKGLKNTDTVYTDYDITLYDMVMAQMSAAPVSYDTADSRKSDTDGLFSPDEEVEGFANPNNFLSGHNKFQFLVLNAANGVSAGELNAYLRGKGVLDGKGELFLRSAEEAGISELFLTFLACIETNNGCSELACGYEVNDQLVYNPLGISHSGSEPEKAARFAYDRGWTDLDTAISEGARWLGENYINNTEYDQNTLYKIRWNPSAPAKHQYTMDVIWASETAAKMGAMAYAFPNAEYRFDIARFEDGKTVAG